MPSGLDGTPQWTGYAGQLRVSDDGKRSERASDQQKYACVRQVNKVSLKVNTAQVNLGTLSLPMSI